jgi:DNA-binding MarR family transcriptional regulator
MAQTDRQMNSPQRSNASALNLWQRVYTRMVQEGRADLSTRQLSVMFTVYLSSPPHTVRGLAAHLEVTKPVITRACQSLEKMGLLKRTPDATDKRSILVERTSRGGTFLAELSELIIESDTQF